MCGMVGGYLWDGWWLGKIGCFWIRGNMLPGDKLSLPYVDARLGVSLAHFLRWWIVLYAAEVYFTSALFCF